MRRFIIERELVQGQTATISGQEAKHMIQVLRLQVGNGVELVGDGGTAFEATIETIHGGRVSVQIGNQVRSHRESPIRISLAQALLKDRKMDTMIRQLTELGIHRWLPFPAGRSVPRPDSKRFEHRVTRWEKIAREALKQCRRNHPPLIEPQVSYDAVLQKAETSTVKLIFSETARAPIFETGHSSEGVESVFLMIGPEGGFTTQEIATAIDYGFSPASLGPRILRSETATVAACALAQHVYGDLGGTSGKIPE